MYLARKINKRLKPLYDALRGRDTILHSDLRKLIQTAIRPFQARCVMIGDAIATDDCGISGVFEPEDHHTPIKIEVHVSKFSDKLYLSDKLVRHMVYAIFQSLSHELIHQYQYRFRDDRAPIMAYMLGGGEPMNERQAYLAEIDEIDAYAHDIAIELFHFFPGNYMDHLRNGRYTKSLAWAMYVEAFHGTDWKDIRNRLYKKVYEHITRIRDNQEGFTCTITFFR
jgi:hypothetical protein